MPILSCERKSSASVKSSAARKSASEKRWRKGLVLLEDATAKLKQDKKTVLPGDVAFRLYDTYGFPLDLTEDILRAENISVDQRVSKNSWKSNVPAAAKRAETDAAWMPRFSWIAPVSLYRL